MLLILGLYAFNTYSKYQRFSLKNYSYKQAKLPNTTNPQLLQQYHSAIQNVNGFIASQWSLHKIDVRSPKNDDATTLAAVSEYSSKLSYVKYLEELIQQEQEQKGELKLNTQIELDKNAIKTIFLQTRKELGIGDKGTLVYEIQKILNKKGANIKRDGIFKEETLKALEAFEKNQGLYPDGKLDLLTLERLLR